MIAMLSGVMSELQTMLARHRGLRLRIATELKIQPSAVRGWKKVPAERVLDVERISGISRHILRPDVFGPAPAGEAAA